MFGTIAADHTRYPDTGIADPAFPRAISRSPAGVVRAVWGQFTYPLRRGVPDQSSSMWRTRPALRVNSTSL
jgi:hypothetical protein